MSYRWNGSGNGNGYYGVEGQVGLIRESGEKIEYEGNEMGTKPRTIYPYNYDFISYDFLKQMLPQPELFELRQILAIPKEDIETRHDYMLSVIKDRVDNADIDEREYFSKYPQYGYSRRKIGFNIDNLWELKRKKYFPGRRRIMNHSTQCKHGTRTHCKIVAIVLFLFNFKRSSIPDILVSAE